MTDTDLDIYNLIKEFPEEEAVIYLHKQGEEVTFCVHGNEDNLIEMLREAIKYVQE